MNRTEFLEILRSQLAGKMHEDRAAAHVRYYEDYIQSQIRSGRSEEDIFSELGDPRLIAKTLLDTDAGTDSGFYEEERAVDNSETYSQEYGQRSGRHRVRMLDLSTWYGKLLVILAAGAVLFLLITVLTAVLPFFLLLAVILIVVRQFRNR